MKNHRHTRAIRKDLHRLAEDTRALFAATTDSTGKRIVKARRNLAAALRDGKGMAGHARDMAFGAAKSATEVARQHPCQNFGIALGLGVLIGLLVTRRWSRNVG